MKLREYLNLNGIPMTAFGAAIGRSHTVVSRLCSGKSSPSMSLMATIERVTNGEVQARDFYPPSGHDDDPSGMSQQSTSPEHGADSALTVPTGEEPSSRCVAGDFHAKREHAVHCMQDGAQSAGRFLSEAVPSVAGPPRSLLRGEQSGPPRDLSRGEFHDIDPPTLKQAVFEVGLKEAIEQPPHKGRLAALDQLEMQVRRRVA